MKTLLIVFCLFLTSYQICFAQEYNVTLFYGNFTRKPFEDTTFLKNVTISDQHLVGISLDKRLITWKYFDFYVEFLYDHQFGQLVREEFVVSLKATYSHFPWNNYLKTSLSFLEGLSYSTRLLDNEGEKVLNYLGFEVSFKFTKKTSLVFRVHHKSAAKTFTGISGDTNFYLCGVRYSF